MGKGKPAPPCACGGKIATVDSRMGRCLGEPVVRRRKRCGGDIFSTYEVRVSMVERIEKATAAIANLRAAMAELEV